MRIIVLEDQVDIAEAVVETLRHDGYDVAWAEDRQGLIDALVLAPTDLAILDVMLPEDEGAGFRLARDLRTSGFDGAILFMTARDAVDDRVVGLDIGGDDYLVKPFSLRELRARVRALLRRGRTSGGAFVRHGRLDVDFAGRRATWDGAVVELTDREFAMLELLLHEPDRIFPTHELLDRLFPEAASGPAVVRVYIRRLRTKIDPTVVTTVPGGYRLGTA